MVYIEVLCIGIQFKTGIGTRWFGYRHMTVWVKAYNEKMSFLSLIVLMLHLVRLNVRPNGYGYYNRCQTQTGITDDYSQPGSLAFPHWE